MQKINYSLVILLLFGFMLIRTNGFKNDYFADANEEENTNAESINQDLNRLSYLSIQSFGILELFLEKVWEKLPWDRGYCEDRNQLIRHQRNLFDT